MLYPGSSHLAGHGTRTHLTASESNERERERDIELISTEVFPSSCQKMTLAEKATKIATIIPVIMVGFLKLQHMNTYSSEIMSIKII